MIIPFLRTLYAFVSGRELHAQRKDGEWSKTALRYGIKFFAILTFCFAVYLLNFIWIHISPYFFSSSAFVFGEEAISSRILSSSESSTSSESGSSSASLFGIISHLDPLIGTISFIVIVGAVLIVEFLFHILHVSTHDTPFQHLIPAVEKELMIAGCTAFTFKIVVNAADNGLDEMWIECLEYADLVVPVFSFVYCFLGIILIAMSVRQCDHWSKAYHMKLLELLDEFFDYADTYRFKLLSFIPNKTILELEFRIFHSIFCETYHIQRKAFAFDEYVDKVFERFVMEIVEIRPWDWMVVSLLFTLNFLRMASKLNFGKHCDHHDYACKNEGLTEIFAIGGLLLLLSCLLVAFYSRYLEWRVMKLKGINGIGYYYSYLHHSEHQKEREQQHVRMNVAELKDAIEQVKAEHEVKKKAKKPQFLSFLPFRSTAQMEDVLDRLRGRWPGFMKVGGDSFSPIGGSMKGSSKGSMRKKNSVLAPYEKDQLKQFGITQGDVEAAIKKYELEHSHNPDEEGHTSAKNQHDHGHGHHPPQYHKYGHHPADPQSQHKPEEGKDSEHQGPSSDKVVGEESSKTDNLGDSRKQFMDIDVEIATIFPFGMPSIYFEMVQTLMMLTSLYFALWITNFVFVGGDIWKFLTVLPGALAAAVYLSVIKRAALLRAVSDLDEDAVLEVIEQTEGSKQLGITMRDKILSRLRDLGEPQAELYTLFHEIDSSRNGSLSREEFAAFLNAIEINFSRKKWHQIFREIDLNYDDKISFEEFFLFLFPDHDVGLALEKRRMKLLGSRVKLKAERYEKENKDHRFLGRIGPATVLPVAIDEEERVNGSPTRVNPNYRDSLKRNVREKAGSNANITEGNNATTASTSNAVNSLGNKNSDHKPSVSEPKPADKPSEQNGEDNAETAALPLTLDHSPRKQSFRAEDQRPQSALPSRH